MLKKFRRIIATFLSVLLVGSVVMPVEASAQEAPTDAFSYAYADQLDLRALEGLIFGTDGQALSAVQLAGAQQAWKTLSDNTTNLNPEKSTLDVEALEYLLPLRVQLGTISLPLVGENGLLEFILPEAGVGVLREYAHAPTSQEAHAAAGLVSDDGGLTLTQPGEGGNMNINLLSLLSLNETAISDSIIKKAGLELGALSAIAVKPDESVPADCVARDMTLVNYNNLNNNKLGVNHSILDEILDANGARAGEGDETFCSAYQVADAKVVVDSPLVKNLVNEQVRPLVEALSLTLNGLLGATGPLSNLNIGLNIPPVTEVGTTISAEAVIDVDQILEDLISTPLQDDPINPLIRIDLARGLIEINVEQLHSGTPHGLNGLSPNTPLINSDPVEGDLNRILETITDLLTGPANTNPNGLMAALERVLIGEEVNGVKQGGLYGTELTITAGVTTKILLGSPTLVGDITLISTLGALLNSDAEAVGTKTEQEEDPYGSYVLEAEGAVMSLLGLLLGGLVKDVLSGVGGVVEGLLFVDDSLLNTLLGNTSSSILNDVLGSLSPLLQEVLQPLANVIINRQRVDALPTGNLFTVSAVEVNVATLLPDASLISLPLATASVMAQNWDPITIEFNVAKTGDGRNLHIGDYAYDMMCELDGTVIFDRTNPTNLQYATSRVGTGFNSVGAANDLELVGASEIGGLSEEIPLPEGAVCSVIANPSLALENFVGLRPTGTTPTRTPYTYFLASDGSGISVSDALNGDTNTWTTSGVSVGSGNEVEVNTDSVTDVWKNHSLTFEIANAITTYDINIVHAYDIDTRDIVVTKGTDGPAPVGETYNFQYSLDDGTTWVSDPAYEINDGGTFIITDVPLIDSTTLNPTSVLMREEVPAPANGGPDVIWNLDGTSLTPATPSHVDDHARSSAFVAGAGLTAASATTPDLALNVINAYPVSVDFEAMLPATGVTSLVWVLGLGLLVALAALVVYIRSRR